MELGWKELQKPVTPTLGDALRDFYHQYKADINGTLRDVYHRYEADINGALLSLLVGFVFASGCVFTLVMWGA